MRKGGWPFLFSVKFEFKRDFEITYTQSCRPLPLDSWVSMRVFI